VTLKEIKARIKPGQVLQCRTHFDDGTMSGWRDRVVVRVNQMGFYTISVVDLRFTVRGPRWRHDWPTASMVRARIGGFIVFRSPDLKTYETYVWSEQPPLPMDCIPEWAFKGFREGNPYKEKQHDR
jgi:hypothetical protein